MLRETLKRNKGITLIALVVTIIVLLILAGISINMLTADNGIIKKALEAKQETEAAQEEENRILKEYEDLMKKYGSGSTGGDGTGGEGTGGEGTGGEGTGGADKKLPTGVGTTPYFPDNTFKKKEGDLNSGLVIKDADGNEYVWVEVPKTSDVYPTAGLDIKDFTDEEYTKIETDLHVYTKYYRNATSYSDVYYADSTDGWFAGSSAYDTAKKKMLKSVYEHGGFWVGRYEAGIENETNIRKAASATATLTPVTKQNMYPYTYVTRTQAKVLAEQVESGSYTSSLMFGVQWDLVLKYIETKSKVTDIKTKLNSASTPIGNYYNSSFTLNRGKFAQYNALSSWYNFNSEDKTSLVTGSKKQHQNLYSNGILLTTGAAEVTKLQNIYDIAGNVSEWTLEKTSTNKYPCANRGGYYCDKGPTLSAGYRNLGDKSYSFSYFGFRISLY